MNISKARTISFDVLLRVARQDSYADESLRAALDESVGSTDAGLATEITMGLLRWQRLLDFLIDRNLTKQSKALDIEVRIALRMGIYQLLFLQRVPEHAAVNESVELVKKARKRSAAPLVNAVLRKVAKEVDRKSSPGKFLLTLLSKDLSRAQVLGMEYSHPDWLVERWLRAFGDERTQALLEANNRVPTVSAHAIDLQFRAEAISSIEKAGYEVKPGVLLKDAWTIRGGNPAACESIQQGRVAIQDEASQAVAHLLPVVPGDSVLDLCAAPGGKTILLSQAAGPQGRVIAADLRAQRVRAMAERFKRAGVRNIECAVLDGAQPLPYDRPFDCILVDTPCSGTGTLARHPEIKWRLRPEDLSDLHRRQVGLLRNALTALAPGGQLVYSTCSLEPEENEFVVSEVLGSATDEFRPIPPNADLQRALRDGISIERLIGADGFFRTFPPSEGTDGFFAVVVERKT